MSISPLNIFSRMAVWSIIAVISLPVALWAAPVEVTFFPQSARVTEVEKIRLETATGGMKKAIFTLPNQADPDTLVTQVTGNSRMIIEDQTWRRISKQDEELIKTLKGKLAALKKERNQIHSDIKALESQVQFWQMQTKAKFKTLADASNMSAAMGKNIKKALVEKLALEPDLEKLDKQIAQRQEELNAAGGKTDSAWEVTVLLSGTKESSVMLSYAYSLGGCGWTPLYRLEATPLSKQVQFTWEGEVWQSSGQDWKQAVIHLANKQPSSALSPLDLPSWVIQPSVPRRVYKKAETAKASRMLEAMAAPSLDEDNAVPAAPALISKGAYTSWSLGKRFIPAGVKHKIRVVEEAWIADFAYLSRPSQGEQVFVRAALKFDEAREIPHGNAVFLLDGAIIGKRSFGVSGREETIFFGTDPMVKAKAVLLSKKSDEKTFFQDKQTYQWDWRIDLENNRTYPVKLRVEEPIPQSRDERIKITLKNDPQPTEQADATQTWIVDLAAKEKRQILTGTFIEAPAKLPLDLGWRR